MTLSLTLSLALAIPLGLFFFLRRSKSLLVTRIDVFGSDHPLRSGSVMLYKQTLPGALFTLSLMLVLVGVVTNLLIDFIDNNNVTLESLRPI